MKKWIAIFFLFAFLFGSTVFGQLLKIPVLVHHYLEHTEIQKDQTFHEYLSNHYSSGNYDHQDNNHNDHEKLPFKSSDSSSFAPTTILSAFASIIKIMPKQIKSNGNFNPQQSYSDTHLNNIWQPPRLV